MTQRKWKTEDGWTVMTGWDRPLQQFFLDITKDCDAEGCVDGFIQPDPMDEDTWTPCTKCGGAGELRAFGNLETKPYSQRNGTMTLKEVVQELDKHLTEWPTEIIAVLQEDCRIDEGNVVRRYEPPIGRLKE